MRVSVDLGVQAATNSAVARLRNIAATTCKKSKQSMYLIAATAVYGDDSA